MSDNASTKKWLIPITITSATSVCKSINKNLTYLQITKFDPVFEMGRGNNSNLKPSSRKSLIVLM